MRQRPAYRGPEDLSISRAADPEKKEGWRGNLRLPSPRAANQGGSILYVLQGLQRLFRSFHDDLRDLAEVERRAELLARRRRVLDPFGDQRLLRRIGRHDDVGERRQRIGDLVL